MKVFKGKHPKAVLVFDCPTNPNINKFIQISQEDVPMELVVSTLVKNHSELSPIELFAPDDLEVIFLLSYEEKNKREQSIYTMIDDSIKFDLQAHLIEYMNQDIKIISFGKYSLYALLGLKKTLSQVGKHKHTIIRIEEVNNGKDIEIKFDTIPNYSVQYLFYNKAVIPTFQNVIRDVVADIYGLEKGIKTPETKTITDYLELQKFISDMKENNKEDFIFFDIETVGLHNSDILGVSIDYIGNDIPVYIPIVDSRFKSAITDILKQYKIVGHNLQFDLRQLVYNGFITYDEVEVHSDTLIMAHLVYNKLLHSLSLKELSKKLLNAPDWEAELHSYIYLDKDVFSNLFEDYFFKRLGLEEYRQYLDVDDIYSAFVSKDKDVKTIFRFIKLENSLNKLLVRHIDEFIKIVKKHIKVPKQDGFHIVPPDIMGKYASLDAYFTKLLYLHLREKWKEQYDFLLNEYNKIIKLVSGWTLKGNKIDLDILSDLEKLIIPLSSKLIYAIYNLPTISRFIEDNGNLDLNSNNQLNLLMVDYYKIDKYKKTSAGNISFDKEGIEFLVDTYKDKNDELSEFISLFAQYKELEKMKTSYLKKIQNETDELGRFYVDYNICGTITGRLSSFFHTLPSRTELGKNFKSLIIPRDKDSVIISADFCLTPDTLIYTSNGWKNLIDVKPDEDKVLNDEGEWLDVYCIVDRGEGEVYEIETEKGFKIKSTLNHKYMCIDNEGNYRLATLKEIIDNDYYLSIKNVDDKFKEEGLELDEYLKFKVDLNLVYDYGLFFDKIKNINYLGKQKVYDLSISGNHLFIANGFIVHNSQLEPRTLASLSGDKELIKVYTEGLDIYKHIASKVYKVDYEDVSKSQRNYMKALVLAILYGMGSKSLAQKLGISQNEAEVIINNFYQEFSAVKDWKQEQYLSVRKSRVVVTALGREIPVVAYSDEEIKRLSVNYPIQSTASEMANISFSDIESLLKKSNLKSFSVGGVHDSIVIETPINEILQTLRVLYMYSKTLLKNKFPFLKVPLVLDASIGISWGNSLEIEEIKDKGTLVVSGVSVDFFKLLHKLYSYDNNISGKIISKTPITVSDLSLYRKYDKVYDIKGEITIGGK